MLTYPQFKQDSAPFILQTDASSVGLGAVLEQNGHVIAYASRCLKKTEQHYSVIQKECLAVVFALKQFRHYLLGRPFQLLTDHSPLQWLSSQKMEGLLCRWSLVMQEYDFTIKYRKGCLNGNADVLSRVYSPVSTAATQVSTESIKADLYAAQQADPVIQLLASTLHNLPDKPTGRQWRHPPFLRFSQLWSQLTISDGIVCRRYKPDPGGEVITVPVLPSSMQQSVMYRCHNSPAVGHQGAEKTLNLLKFEVYWVNMAQDVEKYCRECVTCQHSKLSLSTKAPLVSMPIGNPW